MSPTSKPKRTRGSAARALVTAAVLAAAVTTTSHALAAEPAPPQGVVSLSSSASIEVVRDVLSVSFNTTKEGSDAAAVQSQLKQALDAALAEARKAARPEQVDVRTGSFSLSPRYTNKGVVNGWQGTAELVVEGRDMQAIGQLSGRITSLTISRVGYELSRELREKSEAEVSAQAIARYRAKAADYAKQFGYSGYTIREVSVNPVDAGPIRPMAAMAMKARAAAGDDALPVEPGRGTITINVNGSVQLSR